MISVFEVQKNTLIDASTLHAIIDDHNAGEYGFGMLDAVARHPNANRSILDRVMQAWLDAPVTPAKWDRDSPAYTIARILQDEKYTLGPFNAWLELIALIEAGKVDAEYKVNSLLVSAAVLRNESNPSILTDAVTRVLSTSTERDSWKTVFPVDASTSFQANYILAELTQFYDVPLPPHLIARIVLMLAPHQSESQSVLPALYTAVLNPACPPEVLSQLCRDPATLLGIVHAAAQHQNCLVEDAVYVALKRPLPPMPPQPITYIR